jgi:hypothetical protein
MTSRNTNHDSHHFKAGDNISTGDARNHCAAALVTTVTTDTSRVLKPNVRANRSLRSTDVTGDVVTLVTDRGVAPHSPAWGAETASGQKRAKSQIDFLRWSMWSSSAVLQIGLLVTSICNARMQAHQRLRLKPPIRRDHTRQRGERKPHGWCVCIGNGNQRRPIAIKQAIIQVKQVYQRFSES